MYKYLLCAIPVNLNVDNNIFMYLNAIYIVTECLVSARRLLWVTVKLKVGTLSKRQKINWIQNSYCNLI